MKLFSQDGLPFAAAPRSTRWALLIGINQYPFLGEVNLDGSVNDPKSPSPRGLDELGVEIRNEREVWVRFQNFRPGAHERIPA